MVHVNSPSFLMMLQISADRQMLVFKKGKLSVVSEQIALSELQMSFERIEGFPKDSIPAHVSPLQPLQ